MRSNSERPKILMIGPYPPPYGGIATVIKSLMEQESILENYNLELYRTGRKERGKSFLFQLSIEIYRLIAFSLRLKFKSFEIYHIHTASYWDFFRNAGYILIIKAASNRKVILHIHGGKFNKFFDNSNYILQNIIKFILNISDAIIVTSPSWIEIIKKINNNNNTQIFAISNGFNSEDFHPTSQELARSLLGLPLDEHIILSIGSLEQHKGYNYLIDSIKNISEMGEKILVYIIGSGSSKEELIKLINKNKLEKFIYLIEGNIMHKRISVWINACDIFVLPSLVEGNPTVMFEALGASKPFIGTNVGGIPDIIISEDYGILVEPANSEALTSAILRGLKKNWDYTKIKLYSQNFTWDNISQQLEHIYASLI
jgi:teichuronic acid biosynthesis glycosyltransferase TuaC